MRDHKILILKILFNLIFDRCLNVRKLYFFIVNIKIWVFRFFSSYLSLGRKYFANATVRLNLTYNTLQ
jgi:hypothetical protein